MDNRKPQGQYRTVPPEGHTAMTYVIGGGGASYMTEAAYRAKGYAPVFENLPTEDEYDAAGS